MKIETILENYDFLALDTSSRREFIRTMTASGLLLLLSTGGCEPILDAIRNRPIRRRVNPASPDSMNALAIYKDAIGLMKGLSSSDKRNWINQAGIHGTVAGGFNKCPHRSWFFLPWHRAYLFNFEKICQKLTGEAKFGLPYWNWSMDNSIPSPFWDSGSQLLYSPRTASASSVANSTVVGHDNMETILDETNFLLFGSSQTAFGVLEGGPHNYIHGFVGGTMASGGSPLDPIFWTHHCMIDYCWVDWNINRGHDNTNDQAWTNRKWTDHFVDADGNQVEAAVITTLLMPFLSYQYEPSQIGDATLDAAAGKSESDIKKLQARVEKGRYVKFDIKKRVPFSRGIDLSTKKRITRELPVRPHELERLFEKEQPDKALINIDFVSSPLTNDFFVRVFVNKEDATPQTGTDDIHYAGSFAFFGTRMESEGTHKHEQPAFLVDLSKTLRALREGGLLKDDQPILLQFIAVPIEPGREVKDEILSLEKLDLIISPVTVVEREQEK